MKHSACFDIIFQYAVHLLFANTGTQAYKESAMARSQTFMTYKQLANYARDEPKDPKKYYVSFFFFPLLLKLQLEPTSNASINSLFQNTNGNVFNTRHH